MGKVVQKVRLWNILREEEIRSGREAPLEVEALIDSGATTAALPRDIVEKLGLPISGKTRARYADGRISEKSVSVGLRVEIEGRDTVCRAIVEEEGTKPLLGQIVLEDLDLLVDCKNGRLMPNPESPDMPLLEQI